MLKIKYDVDEEYNFKRQFELQQQIVEPKSLSKFKDILNSAKDVNKKKKIELASYEKQCHLQETSTTEDNQLEFIQDQTEQVLIYQSYLKTKLDQVLKAKLLLEKQINLQKENLNQIKMEPDHVQKELDQKVTILLRKTKNFAVQFQKQVDKFRCQSERNYEKSTRDIENNEYSVKEIQNRTKKLQQKNSELQQQIISLSEQEDIKKKKLQECFQISDYIEFFMEVKLRVLDQLIDSESDSSQVARSFIQAQRHSTRNEILSLVDEFYKTQDINKLSQQIVDTYHYLLDHLNMQTNEYNIFTEEKTLKQQQITLLDQEISDCKAICKIEVVDEQQFESYINTIIEGPPIIHENSSLNYHLHGYQLCLITIHQKLIDMIQRLCNNIIWISETTKFVPKSLDNKCMQYLRVYTKNDLNMYVPITTSSMPINKSTSQKNFGQFIQLKQRNGSVTSQEFYSEKIVEIDQKTEFLNRFKQLEDYEVILQSWNNVAKNDLIMQKFNLEFNFDSIDLDLPTTQIVCALYDAYHSLILEQDFLKYFSVQFQYYQDIMTHIQKKNQSWVSNSLNLGKRYSSEITSPFIMQTKQVQLKRLQELANSTVYDYDTVGSSKKTINTTDDSKYHEYFIHESTKIKKQFPALQQKLVSQTLSDIEAMKQKELNDNYQQSDQISSDQDYLNQERRNLKGILSKKKQKPSTADSQESRTKSQQSSNSKTKIIKQVQLLYKINKLSSTSRKLKPSNSFNSDLSKYTENVKRKISDYFSTKLDLEFCQQEEKSILLKPLQFDKTLSASKSMEPPPLTPHSDKPFHLDRIDSIRQISQQDSIQMNSAKKEKSYFLIKRK